MSDDTQCRTIGLVVEADADARAARALADRLLLEARDWIEPSMLDGLRRWRGVEPEQRVTYWKKIKTLARQHDVRSHGHFSGEPAAPDAQAARRALLLFEKFDMPHAVVLLRDADDQPERREGLSQARDDSGLADRVALGVAIPEREAWILAGFVPRDAQERQALTAERSRLGFDPSLHPARLRGEGERSAKRALSNLVRDHERESQCLESTSLEHLRARGARCGLKDFLDEIERRVVSKIV